MHWGKSFPPDCPCPGVLAKPYVPLAPHATRLLDASQLLVCTFCSTSRQVDHSCNRRQTIEAHFRLHQVLRGYAKQLSLKRNCTFLPAMACCCAHGTATAQCCQPASLHQHTQSLLPPSAVKVLWHPAAVQRLSPAQQRSGDRRGARASMVAASASAVYQMAPLATAGLGIKDLGGLTSALGFALAALFVARAWGNVSASSASA
jgi:hypothetical protein